MNYPLTLPIRALHESVRNKFPNVLQIDVYPHGYRHRGRSLPQNALYWSWLGELENQSRNGLLPNEWAGYGKDDFHEVFKSEFLIVKSLNVQGRLLWITKSTAKINSREFTEYLDNIKRYVKDKMDYELVYSDEPPNAYY